MADQDKQQPGTVMQVVHAPPPPLESFDDEAESLHTAHASKAGAHGGKQHVGWEQLTESGKDAWRALARAQKAGVKGAQLKAAEQAAQDASRDHAVVFGAAAGAPPATSVAQSKDPDERNQAPAGTRGETSGPPTGTQGRQR